MYKNIIFDIGGVVVDFTPHMFLLDRFTNEKLEQELYKLSFGSKEWAAMDCGLMARDEGNRRMLANAEKIGRKYEMEMIICDWEDMLKSKEETIRLITNLKNNGYAVYYLSNMAADTFDNLKNRRFWKLFNGGVVSCHVKISKPDTKIFLGTLRKFNINADECIFIDDSPANVESAGSVGIKSLLFRSASLLAKDLTGLGVQVKAKRQ